MKQNDKNAVFYNVFVPWEAEASEVFEGQMAKNTVIYRVFFNPTSKNSGICEVFSSIAS